MFHQLADLFIHGPQYNSCFVLGSLQLNDIRNIQTFVFSDTAVTGSVYIISGLQCLHERGYFQDLNSDGVLMWSGSVKPFLSGDTWLHLRLSTLWKLFVDLMWVLCKDQCIQIYIYFCSYREIQISKLESYIGYCSIANLTQRNDLVECWANTWSTPQLSSLPAVSVRYSIIHVWMSRCTLCPEDQLCLFLFSQFVLASILHVQHLIKPICVQM